MPPRLLVIDDLFGRGVLAGRNIDRENLCAHFLWRDVTGDDAANSSPQRVLTASADVVFCRGQRPASADVGDVVENDLTGALAVVREGWERALLEGSVPWSMVLIDLCFYTGEVTPESHRHTAGMPVGRTADSHPNAYFGLTLLDAIHRNFPDLPVCILSSNPREQVSLEFSLRGALGFIARDDVKGVDRLDEALWHHGLLPDSAEEVIGRSLPMLLTLREARRAAGHRESLLICGERGTGKEMLASYINRVTATVDSAARRPFIAVNSAVLRTDLAASELFGIEPRTASGVDGKMGLIESAHGGDLFLDEIADLPPETQASVLRVLQDRQVTRVGARVGHPVDVRFLSATNNNLEAGKASLRPDLLDRLRMGGTLRLPPLRDRKGDIPLLAAAFLRDAESERVGRRQRQITPEAMAALLMHSWPGNIRQLRACLFDAVNRYPDVEYLVPRHLRIDGEAVSHQPLPAHDLSTLFAAQEAVGFDQDDIDLWSGRLLELQRGQVRVLARYLQGALDATRRRTPLSPKGQLQIHPAMKLATGDPELSASQAADIVKRILSPLEGELHGDLREALAIAVRLRPRSKINPVDG
jgi:DNA-binding NtrC family response regulator